MTRLARNKLRVCGGGVCRHQIGFGVGLEEGRPGGGGMDHRRWGLRLGQGIAEHADRRWQGKLGRQVLNDGSRTMHLPEVEKKRTVVGASVKWTATTNLLPCLGRGQLVGISRGDTGPSARRQYVW